MKAYKLTNVIAIITILISISFINASSILSIPIIHGDHAPGAREEAMKKTNNNNKFQLGNAALISQPVRGNYIQFAAQITINGAPFFVQVDTGSSLTAVSANTCSSCGAGPNADLNIKTANPLKCTAALCTIDNSCASDNSCAFKVTYGDGSSIQGTVILATTTLAGVNGTAPVGAITYESSNFESPYADGIMGMMPFSPNLTSTIFQQIQQQNSLNNIFSIYLDYMRSGTLYLSDLTTQFGAVTYTPLNYLNIYPFYAVACESMQIDSYSLLYDASDFGVFIFDTGTTDILVPTEIFTAIKNYFQTHYCSVAGMCTNPGLFTGNGVYVDIRPSLPTLKFNIQNDFTVEVAPEAYVLVLQDTTGRTAYYLGLGSSGSSIYSSTPISIFGYAGMRGSYIVYDQENSRLGYANIPSGASSSHSVVFVYFVFALSVVLFAI